MPNINWTVHTASNTTIEPEAITGDWADLTRGRRTRFRFWFDADTSVSTTATYGTSVYGDTVYGNVSQTLEDQYTEWLTLQDYLDYADAAAYGTGINHRPWYHEQLPADATVGSLVVGIEPTQDLDDRGVTGVWGLITGGDDRRNSTLTNWLIELELFVLAEYGDFADHNDIDNELAT